MAAEPLRFRPSKLRELGTSVLDAVGTPLDLAALVSDHLVDANLTGHDSHGVIRVPDYVQQARSGVVRAGARPRVIQETASAALVSGEWGWGQAAGVGAIEEAVARARAHGVAAVGVVRCTHLGRLGDYMERACADGAVALAWAGGLGLTHAAVPYGGMRGAYGANPIAAGFPTAAGPIVMDFATTAVAGGKVLVARDAGASVPPGSIVDSEGRPTTNPADFIAGGALLPFGGHKGYGLAVLAELLAQALTGSDRYGDEHHGGVTFRNAGALFLALEPSIFRPVDDVLAVAADFTARVRAVPPAPGFDRVYLPGEIEALKRAERANACIELERSTWKAIVEVAEELNVPVPEPVP